MKSFRKGISMIVDRPEDIVFDDVFIKINLPNLPQTVFLKLEGLSITHSIKLKSALSMIENFEKEGRLKSGDTLIESSSGNLGLALSMICASRGYRFICVSDPNLSPHTANLIRAYGAELIVVRETDVNSGFLGTRIALINRMLRDHPELHSTPGVCRRLGVVGCGLIAHRIVTLLIHSGWKIDSVQLTDLSDERARLFASKCQKIDLKSQISDLAETLQTSDLVIFATSAVGPQPMDTAWFAHAPTVLHMSLRDLPPAIILISQNVADDVEHCVKAGTSLDLTCQLAGNRDCIAGSIADVINGRIVPDASRPRVFSPFGMGILDLAVARDIEKSLRHDEIFTLPDFFPAPYTA